MWKWITFFVLAALSLCFAYFLSAWAPDASIREIYVVEGFGLIEIILYAPFAFAIFALLDWWRKSFMKSK